MTLNPEQPAQDASGHQPDLKQASISSAGSQADLSDAAFLRATGAAFTAALLDGLPPYLSDIGSYLKGSGLAEAGRREKKGLLSSPDAEAAGEAGRVLAEYGLSPAKMRLAIRAVASLTEDLVEDGVLLSNTPVLIGTEKGRASDATCLEFRETALEIAAAMEVDLPRTRKAAAKYGSIEELPLPRSSAVLKWLMDVSCIKPCIFEGRIAEACDQGILLTNFHRITDEATRWSLKNGDAALEDLKRTKVPVETPGWWKELGPNATPELYLSFTDITSPRSLERWIGSPNPAFKGRAPRDLIISGDLEELERAIYLMSSGEPSS